MNASNVIRAVFAAAVLMMCTGAAPSSDPPPPWAFIAMKPGSDLPKDKQVTAPGSKLRLQAGKLGGAFTADWFPGDHPKMPPVVEHGRPEKKLAPCAECHLANGVGGADSAVLAGLPADYIVAQFEEFRSGRRSCAASGVCSSEMEGIAKLASPADVRAAAEYFARTPYRSRTRVLEAAMVPKAKVVWFVYMPVKGAGLERLGERILEMPDDFTSYLIGDWRAPVTAYVPPGSIAHGKVLVEGRGAGLPCAACHGAKLQGMGNVPPLAGRSPTYLYRQLYNIQYGYRKGPAVAQMLPEVAHLNAKDRLAIAAYLAAMKN